MTPEEHVESAEANLTVAFSPNLTHDPMRQAIYTLAALAHATIAQAMLQTTYLDMQLNPADYRR